MICWNLTLSLLFWKTIGRRENFYYEEYNMLLNRTFRILMPDYHRKCGIYTAWRVPSKHNTLLLLLESPVSNLSSCCIKSVEVSGLRKYDVLMENVMLYIIVPVVHINFEIVWHDQYCSVGTLALFVCHLNPTESTDVDSNNIGPADLSPLYATVRMLELSWGCTPHPHPGQTSSYSSPVAEGSQPSESPEASHTGMKWWARHVWNYCVLCIRAQHTIQRLRTPNAC